VKNDALTKKMVAALNALREHPMEKLDDGSWAHPDWSINSKPYYSRVTIQALVQRGLAEYTLFRRGFNGQVPMKVIFKGPAKAAG